MDDKQKAKEKNLKNKELFQAIPESDIEQIVSVLENGANINFKYGNELHNTPLHWAIIKGGNLKIIELLINKGAKTDIKNKSKKTPLDLARHRDLKDVIAFLEEIDTNRKNVNTSDGELINAIHGNIYHIKLLMLFLYRGISRGYSFKLRAEIKVANKFDDLVFEYIEGNKKIYRLLQAKHKFYEFKKITVYQLLYAQNGNYSLVKYFYSYQDCKNKDMFKENTIKDVIICTNIDFDFKGLKKAHIELVKVEDEDDILDMKKSGKQPSKYKFDINNDFSEFFKEKLQEEDQKITEQIKDFFEHLIFAVDQPNENELGKIIRDEMRKDFNFDYISTENAFNKLFMEMSSFLQGKQKDLFFSSEKGIAFFDEVRKGIPIWFDIRNPVDSFVGRVQVLLDVHKKLFEDTKNTDLQIICISGCNKNNNNNNIWITEFIRIKSQD